RRARGTDLAALAMIGKGFPTKGTRCRHDQRINGLQDRRPLLHHPLGLGWHHDCSTPWLEPSSVEALTGLRLAYFMGIPPPYGEFASDSRCFRARIGDKLTRMRESRSPWSRREALRYSVSGD